MNKWKYLFLLFLVAALLSGCFLQYHYINNVTEKLLISADQLKHSLRENDLEAAQALLGQFTEQWTHHRNRLFSLIDHNIVHNVDVELAALQEDLMNRNVSQLYAESARLTQALHALSKPEELSLSNIF